jgi:hypothetical protein
VRLRANESNIMHETRRLYSEIGTLRNLLTQHGIPIPPTTNAPPEPNAPTGLDDHISTLFVGKSFQDGNQIHVQRGRNKSSSKSPFPTSSESGSEISPSTLQGEKESWTVSSTFTTTSSKPASALPCSPEQVTEASDDVATSHSMTVEGRSLGLPPQAPPTKLIAELDQTTIGMEFVLT